MTDSTGITFERGQFNPAYAVVPEPEYPGCGTWRYPFFSFGRSGELSAEPQTRWGAPLIVELHPSDSPPWIGMFAAGGLGGLTGVYACPSPTQLVVLVDGLAYLVNVGSPEVGATIAHDQVSQVVPVEEDLLLLVRMIDVVAVGVSGIQWHSTRLAVDDLRIERASMARIVCSCDLLQTERAVIALDPATGSQIDGPRLDSFWPPEAL